MIARSIIRNDEDFERHVNYIHFNPVKYGYVNSPVDWSYSSIHRYIQNGIISNNWACCDVQGDFGEVYGDVGVRFSPQLARRSRWLRMYVFHDAMAECVLFFLPSSYEFKNLHLLHASFLDSRCCKTSKLAESPTIFCIFVGKG